MPVRRRRVRRRLRGGNIFKKIWSGIKKIGGPLHKFVKDNKLISKGLALAPGHIGSIGSSVASQLGYGRRRRRVGVKRRLQGGAMLRPYSVPKFY